MPPTKPTRPGDLAPGIYALLQRPNRGRTKKFLQGIKCYEISHKNQQFWENTFYGPWIRL